MNIDLTQLDTLSDRFTAMPGVANAALQTQMQASMTAMAQDIQTNKLSGQVLNARSGRLRESITANVAVNGNVTSGSIGSDLPYAAIHEYGGTILRGRIKTTQIVEPERSYLRSTLDEQSDSMQAQLTAAVMEAIDP